MLGYIKGRVLSKNNHGLLLLLQGDHVGYWITLPKNSLHNYSLGASYGFFIVEQVSTTGEKTLFGFSSSLDLFWFHVLTKIPGLGGKTAQNILFFYDPRALYGLLLEENFVLLQKVDGVGLKMAQRVVQELREKLPSLAKELHEEEKNHEEQCLLFDFLQGQEDTQALEKPFILEEKSGQKKEKPKETLSSKNPKKPLSLKEKKAQWLGDYERSKTAVHLEKEILDILDDLGYAKDPSLEVTKEYFRHQREQDEPLPPLETIIATLVQQLSLQGF